MFSLQLFMDISSDYCTWQSFFCPKRTNLEKLYYYESFIQSYHNSSAFRFGNCNSTCNETQLIQRLLTSNCFLILLAELSFVSIPIVAYIYLFHYVWSELRVTANKRHDRADLNKKLALTVTCTYLYLLVFTSPQLAKQVIHFRGPVSDKRMKVDLEYWCNILPHSNCYANTLIILYINRQNYTWNNK